MKCCICANEATIHIDDSATPGVIRRINLCKLCAEKTGALDPTGINIDEVADRVRSRYESILALRQLIEISRLVSGKPTPSEDYSI